MNVRRFPLQHCWSLCASPQTTSRPASSLLIRCYATNTPPPPPPYPTTPQQQPSSTPSNNPTTPPPFPPFPHASGYSAPFTPFPPFPRAPGFTPGAPNQSTATPFPPGAAPPPFPPFPKPPGAPAQPPFSLNAAPFPPPPFSYPPSQATGTPFPFPPPPPSGTLPFPPPPFPPPPPPAAGAKAPPLPHWNSQQLNATTPSSAQYNKTNQKQSPQQDRQTQPLQPQRDQRQPQQFQNQRKQSHPQRTENTQSDQQASKPQAKETKLETQAPPTHTTVKASTATMTTMTTQSTPPTTQTTSPATILNIESTPTPMSETAFLSQDSFQAQDRPKRTTKLAPPTSTAPGVVSSKSATPKPYNQKLNNDIKDFQQQVSNYISLGRKKRAESAKVLILKIKAALEKKLAGSFPPQYIRSLSAFFSCENDGYALVDLLKKVDSEPNSTKATVMEAKVRMYINNNHLEYAAAEALEIRKLQEPLSQYSNWALMSYYVEQRDFPRALELWGELKDQPNIGEKIYEPVLTALVESGEIYEALSLINKLEASGEHFDDTVYYSVCMAYATLDDLPMAVESFVKLQQCDETHLTNRASLAILRLAIRSKEPGIFEEVFPYLRKVHTVPESYFISLLIQINRHNMAAKCARLVFQEMVSRNVLPSPQSRSVLLNTLDAVQVEDPIGYLTFQKEYLAWTGEDAPPPVVEEDEDPILNEQQ